MAHNPEENQEFLSNSGGDVAFRHQQAVEIVPFFLQPEDEPAAWARVVHALRFSTAWGQGNLSKPYPLHLAHTLLEDMKAAVPPYDVASDEESDMI